MTSIILQEPEPVVLAQWHSVRDEPATRTSLPWFAIRVKSRHENVTAMALHRKGYEEFSPTYHTRNRWSDRDKELDLPLFPGYIFCRFNPLHRLPILTTPGIVSILGVGRIPLPVADDE